MALHRLPLVILDAVAFIALACSGTPAPSISPGPTPTPAPSAVPSPTPAGELSPAQLRYALLEQFAPISWCDPDFYPIQQQDEQLSADEHWPEIAADRESFDAIAAHLGFAAGRDPADLDSDERLAAYREWKLLNAVGLTPLEGGLFEFDLITETDPGLGRGIRSTGTIDVHGAIDVALQEQTGLVACPICLARGTLIATPSGDVAVETLEAGDLVWTVDADGTRVARPLVRIGSTPVPLSHQVVHLVLADGREVWVSPGHPTPDGRRVGDLRAGDSLDGALIIGAEREAYSGGVTFDILPDGATGLYWANGILLGSTLR